MNHELDPQQAHALLESGEAVALDVREPWEWQEAHIRHALHIPLGELAQRLQELPQERRLVAVCHSGSRSGAVVDALRQRGYDIVNLAGGLASWQASNLPLEAA